MTEFETLLQENLTPLKRYINFKINNPHDAEDLLQEVCLAATVKFSSLKDKNAFKAWLIGIANHKCNDYYRQKAKGMQIPLDDLSESVLSVGRCGITVQEVVRDTLDALGGKEKQILYLYYFKNLSQEEIARQLAIPTGTVKSRLHHAKEKFKQQYPYKKSAKGDVTMKKLPAYLPAYTIEKSELPPFEVIHEELPGMFVIPRIGEALAFAMYDMPSRKQNGVYQLKTDKKVILHGVEGISIQKNYNEDAIVDDSIVFAQLTDTHCKYLGGISRNENGGEKITTFLDPDFDEYFGIGENNCGFPTHRKEEGVITKANAELIIPTEKDASDIVGRFRITFNGAVYDTIRLIDYENSNQGGMLSEYFIDKNGRTVLWRRFNRNDWAFKRYGKLWTEMLPENETLTVNGETYVHWYDCITDYIL